MTISRDERQSMLELIRSSDAPVTAKQVTHTTLGSSKQTEVNRVQDVLDDLKKTGGVFEFPPRQAGQAVRFGSVPPLEWVRERILNKIKSSGDRVTERLLRESLHKWEKRYYDDAIGGLVKERKLFYLRVQYSTS